MRRIPSTSASPLPSSRWLCCAILLLGRAGCSGSSSGAGQGGSPAGSGGGAGGTSVSSGWGGSGGSTIGAGAAAGAVPGSGGAAGGETVAGLGGATAGASGRAGTSGGTGGGSAAGGFVAGTGGRSAGGAGGSLRGTGGRSTATGGTPFQIPTFVSGSGTSYAPIWSNPVNSVYVNGTFMMGKTDTPAAIKTDIEKKLNAIGVEAAWVDDSEYDVGMGNVHCATNTKRTPVCPGFTGCLMPGLTP